MGVPWLPLFLLSVAAVWAAFRFGRGSMRVILTTSWALFSVITAWFAMLYGLYVILMPLYVGWTLFMAAVVARTAKDMGWVKYVAMAVVLAWPLTFFGLVIYWSSGGEAVNL